MSDDKLLQRIRDRFDYASAEWRPIRDEGDKDMLCVSGDVWAAVDPNGKRARLDAKRPALTLDELGQHFNGVINSVRANPRSPKFSPTGNGANDAGATFYQEKWREIEYRSHAQLAYITAFENTIQRSYGFVRVNTRKESPRSFNQDIWIEPFPNPNMVLPDPSAQRPDSGDMKFCFVFEMWSQDDFLHTYPKAQKRDFSGYLEVKPWVQAKSLMLSEYWEVTITKRELVQMQDPQTGNVVTAFSDELEQLPEKGIVLQREESDWPVVTQYLTNGIEILETNDWPGKYIPIVSCYGKVLYLLKDGQAQRQILSMTRLARDPFMLYCYIRTCEAEAIGGVPRNAWIGYKGQFADPESWQKANHEPVAFLEAHPQLPAGGDQVLPLPQRQPWDPPIQNLEIAAEASRRAILSAMGISPLPTAAQRQNEKSGVALKKIDDQQMRGSFHFVDHYNDMLRQVGVIGEDLMDKIYDTARTVGTRQPNDKAKMVRINDPQATDERGQPAHISTKGDYTVTISEGPSYDSEREESREFVTNLVSSPTMELVPPPVRPKFLAEAIRAQELGPKGDALADILDPKDPKGMDPQMENAQLKHGLQQAQQQLQAAGKIIETKQIEQQAKVKTEQIAQSANVAIAKMNNATKVLVARITAAKQSADAAKEDQEEAIALNQQLTHEATQNAMDRTHDLNQAILEHQQALDEAQQAHAHTVTEAQMEPQPEQGVEA